METSSCFFLFLWLTSNTVSKICRQIFHQRGGFMVDLYEILKHEISDLNNNPARKAELVEYLDGLFKSDNILNGDFNG